jgi:hypothetical protein
LEIECVAKVNVSSVLQHIAKRLRLCAGDKDATENIAREVRELAEAISKSAADDERRHGPLDEDEEGVVQLALRDVLVIRI